MTDNSPGRAAPSGFNKESQQNSEISCAKPLGWNAFAGPVFSISGSGEQWNKNPT